MNMYTWYTPLHTVYYTLYSTCILIYRTLCCVQNPLHALVSSLCSSTTLPFGRWMDRCTQRRSSSLGCTRTVQLPLYLPPQQSLPPCFGDLHCLCNKFLNWGLSLSPFVVEPTANFFDASPRLFGSKLGQFYTLCYWPAMDVFHWGRVQCGRSMAGHGIRHCLVPNNWT